MTEQIEETVEAPKPGTPEYDQAMLARKRDARGDGPAEPTAEGPQKPEGVPDKFWNAETGEVDYAAMAKSYAELEAKLGGQTEEPEPDADPEQDGTREIVESAGLDYQKLGQKIADKGDLDPDDYTALEKIGVPKRMVEAHVQLLKFHQETQTSRAVDYIGGEQETQDLLQWAAKNLSRQEQETYNAMLASNRWKVAVDTLQTLRGKSRKTAAEPELESGAGSAGGVSEGYASPDERRIDMRNPLYFERGPKGDAFRATVARKTAASGWLRGR